MIPFGADSYFHSVNIVLDWCQNFHSDIEMQILEFRGDALLHLPRKCEKVEEILVHCQSYKGGDPQRRVQRAATVERLLNTTRGLKLAGLVACWYQSGEGMTVESNRNPTALPSDCYLASQGLPPLWLEHYPFHDEVRMLEIVFLNKDDLGNSDLKYSKLALLGFYLLHMGQVENLEFLTRWFGIEPAMTKLWQGLFLVDLCSFDRYFQKRVVVQMAVESLQDSTAQLNRPLPLETLMKLQSFGCAVEAKQMFLANLQTYLLRLSNPVAVARQGLSFCLSAGDVTSGLSVVRAAYRSFRGMSEGIFLLRHVFDQILGAGRLEDLIMQDLTGMEEAVFIDWAGNKRDDPECSLYLTLYFLRKSKIDSARQLYKLNKDNTEQSIHKVQCQHRLST